MPVKVLGICGSPVKDGNTELLLSEALSAAKAAGDVEIDTMLLHGKNIKDCVHCNWCVTRQEKGKFCSQQDDMTLLYPIVMEADALLVATPVYFGRLSGRLANFLDRLRVFREGRYYHQTLRNKVGGALAVAWRRNAGLETALFTIHYAFFAHRMLPVSPDARVCQWGVTAVSTEYGSGKFDPEDKKGVLKDELGLESARSLGTRVVEIARLIQAGSEYLKKSAKV